eukprot:10302685-Lingulodinium_polyedra.AAC.1
MATTDHSEPIRMKLASPSCLALKEQGTLWFHIWSTTRQKSLGANGSIKDKTPHSSLGLTRLNDSMKSSKQWL